MSSESFSLNAAVGSLYKFETGEQHQGLIFQILKVEQTQHIHTLTIVVSDGILCMQGVVKTHCIKKLPPKMKFMEGGLLSIKNCKMRDKFGKFDWFQCTITDCEYLGYCTGGIGDPAYVKTGIFFK